MKTLNSGKDLKEGRTILTGEKKLKGKQKRFLRAMAAALDPILQVGKAGISENLIVQVDTALETRELVKIRVLSNCPIPVEAAAEEISRQTGAYLIQVVGRNFILFRRSRKKPIFELP